MKRECLYVFNYNSVVRRDFLFMLKFAMYFNVFLLFVMSIFFLVKICGKKEEYEKLKPVIILYIMYDILSFGLCFSNIVEVDWDLLFIIPIFLLSLIMLVIGFSCVNRKNNKVINFNSDNYNVYNSSDSVSKKYIIMCILPALIFIIPYIYELYILNSCDYLLYYNYQAGIVVSDDSYIAIVNNKPKLVTLQKNLFNRKGKFIRFSTYSIHYGDDIQITTNDYKYDEIEIEDEEIKKIALDMKNRCKSVRSMQLTYFSNRKYAIVSVLSGIDGGEFLYYNNRYVQHVKVYGGLESIIYYK